MKTAISLPDELFRMAEGTARRLRISRSELYSKALIEFLKTNHDDSITQSLNDFYSRNSSALDPVLHEAQMRSVDKDNW